VALRAGIEVLEKRKNVLDHLGRSRRFLETLLQFGSALSEVIPLIEATFSIHLKPSLNEA
jgi:hypothetical protein